MRSLLTPSPRDATSLLSAPQYIETFKKHNETDRNFYTLYVIFYLLCNKFYYVIITTSIVMPCNEMHWSKLFLIFETKGRACDFIALTFFSDLLESYHS